MDISRLFVSATETIQEEETPLNGQFPKWLRGSFIQTGPGLLDIKDFTMNDYLDGFAILSKCTIEGPIAKLVKKYPVTESYKTALEKGKPWFMEYGTTAKRDGIKSGLFAKILTTLSRDDMSDNCSASIYKCGQTLIASSATTFLHKINLNTLNSEARFDAKKSLGQNGYGVHPLIDYETGTMWNMGFSVLPTVKYNVVKIPRATSNDIEMEELLSKGTTVASISPRWTGALSFNHSFGMTKNFIIFIEQPCVVKISRVLAATIKDYAVKDWLEWRESDKNRFLIMEKSTGKVHATEYMSAESFFFLHVINCYEDGNTIVLDISTSKTPKSTEATSLSKLRNNIIDEHDPWSIERYAVPIVQNIKSIPENSNLLESELSFRTKALAIRKGNSVILTPEVMCSRGAIRNAINLKFSAKKYSIIYTSGSFLSLGSSDAVMAHSICKLNMETKETQIWTAPDEFISGDFTFVPRNDSPDIDNEDDGVLLATMSSANANSKDFLVALDGKSFKEIGRAEFDSQIPMGMHGIFIPSHNAE